MGTEDAQSSPTELLLWEEQANNMALEYLESWYHDQCDGDWEHQFGIHISTLDNPGWSVRIDLTGTDLEGKSFPTCTRDNGDTDWVRCWIQEDQFHATGDPSKLNSILRVFQMFADRMNREPRPEKE
jgi:hypothetical protein